MLTVRGTIPSRAVKGPESPVKCVKRAMTAAGGSGGGIPISSARAHSCSHAVISAVRSSALTRKVRFAAFSLDSSKSFAFFNKKNSSHWNMQEDIIFRSPSLIFTTPLRYNTERRNTVHRAKKYSSQSKDIQQSRDMKILPDRVSIEGVANRREHSKRCGLADVAAAVSLHSSLH